MAGITRLDAVNQILESAGDTAINSLAEVDTAYDAGQASRIIDQVSREICEESWWFNTRKEVEYSPDSSGHITIPSSVAQWAPTVGLQQWGTKYIERSITDIDDGLVYRRVYDQGNNTDVITEDPVYADILEYKTFDELPPVVKQYVTYKAARIYERRASGDPTQYNVASLEESAAYDNMMSYELNTDQPNMFDEAHAQWGAFGNRPRRGGATSKLIRS